MEYQSITNRVCRVTLYRDELQNDCMGHLKFNSIAEAYKFLNNVFMRVGYYIDAGQYFIEEPSLTTMRKYLKKSRTVKGYACQYCNQLFNDHHSFKIYLV